MKYIYLLLLSSCLSVDAQTFKAGKLFKLETAKSLPPSLKNIKIARTEAEQALMLLEKYFVDSYLAGSKKALYKQHKRTMFKLDNFYIEISKFKKDGELFYNYRAGILDPHKKGLTLGGGNNYWSAIYSLKTKTIMSFKYNSDI